VEKAVRDFEKQLDNLKLEKPEGWKRKSEELLAKLNRLKNGKEVNYQYTTSKGDIKNTTVKFTPKQLGLYGFTADTSTGYKGLDTSQTIAFKTGVSDELANKPLNQLNKVEQKQAINSLVKVLLKNLPKIELDKIATAVGCKTKTPVKKSEGGRIGFGVGSGSMLACIDAKWEKNPKGFFSKLTGVSSAGLDKLWKYAAPYWFPAVIVATGRLEAFKDPTKPEMWWDIMLASDAVKRWGLDKVQLSQLKNASWLKRADIIGKLLLKFPGDKILTQAAKVARPLIIATETLSAVKGIKSELDLVKEYASKNNIPYEKARLAYYASGAALKPRWEGDKSFKSWAFSKLDQDLY